MTLLIFLLLYGLLLPIDKTDSARPKNPRCLEENRVLWRDAKPYTTIVNNSHTGIVVKVFKKAMDTCCDGHYHFEFDLNFTSQAEIPDILMDEKKNREIEFVLPVQRDSKAKNFLIYPFVPLVVSPGIAVFVKPSKPGAQAIIQAVSSMAPFMSLIAIGVGIIGCLFWMIDNFTLLCFGEEPEPFYEGVVGGIWWAFVTMTTVGYGDKVPKTKPGRILSVFWVIWGLVFCGICVSSLTSGILVSITKTEVTIMSENVAVLRESEEFKYARNKQANTFEFDTVEEVIEALQVGNVTIALLDAMVAGSYKELLSVMTLNKVIETMTSNGVIFVNDGAKFAQCFREYIMDRQQAILELVTQNVDSVQYSSFSDDTMLIDPNLPMFKYGISGMVGLLLIFMFFGLSSEWIRKYWKKRKLKKKLKRIGPLEQTRREEMEEERKVLLREFTEIVDVCNDFIEKLENHKSPRTGS